MRAHRVSRPGLPLHSTSPGQAAGEIVFIVRAMASPRTRSRLSLLAPILVGLLAACQEPDVGQSCSFDGSALTDGPVAADFLETGKTECENLVCIRSPEAPAGSRVKNNPYCSKPCVADDDCSSDETGLVCRSVVLDAEFLARLPEDVRRKYLGDVQFSSYCAIPLR